MRFLILLLASCFLVSACAPAETKPSASAERYPLRGKVLSVDKVRKKAKIQHEEIPGYMEAMTMDFPIKDDWVWEDLTPGSEVRAELVVDNENGAYWLEKLGIIAGPRPDQPAPETDERFAQIGKEVPDFTLTNQDGKRISLNDFRGKALALTFIYRECPLPEYCIKMSRTFSDLANQIGGDPQARENIRLLSISFDPARDTPEKLKDYGLGYLGPDPKGDLELWQLAVGTEKEVRQIADFFGLRYEVDPNDKAQINHSLRTAVIGPDGKVTKVFSGNEWTQNELLRELNSALNAGK